MQLVRPSDPPVFEPGELPEPVLVAGEVRVSLRAASLNRRDAWIWKQSGYCPLPVTLGSDGSGVVAEVGPGVTGVEVGDEVTIDPALHWGARDEHAGPEFDILGAPTAGTFAEQVVVPAQNVVPKPARLTWEEAAALNLAGLTAWRAVVTCGEVTSSGSVLVTGAGGGVATFAVQIAAAHGATVFVTSSSAEKIDRACKLGAQGGFDYRTPNWVEAVVSASEGGVDMVVDSAGPTVWGDLIQALRPGGRLVTFGATAGTIGPVEAFPLFWRWRQIIGTTMGSPRDYRALLAHVDQASWRPAIDSSYPLDQLAAAAARLESPARFGKVVLTIP